MEQGSPTSLNVVSMIIWLSTGNGKFFELVRWNKSIVRYFYSINVKHVSFSLFSMALAMSLNKFYRNHQKQLFVGVIIILQQIQIDSHILKFSNHSFKLDSESKDRQELVHKVFYVRNIFLSNEIERENENLQAISNDRFFY